MDVRLVELRAAAGKEADDTAKSEPDAVSGGG
jgi:hypothetical protein